jgi:hypothetical protein
MRKTTLVPALTLAATAALPGTSMAQLSANIGWTSEYVFRGIYQEDSSAYAGFDYAQESGFYAGIWGADVGLGNEIDYYLGFAGGEDFTWKVGATLYTYTDDFDDQYQEINLGIGYGIFALDVAIGEWDGGLFGSPSLDYDFTSITITPEMGPYFKVGIWGGDFEEQWLFPNLKTAPGGGDGDYFEIGYTYGIEEHGVDLSVAFIYSPDLIVNEGTTGDSILTFGIKKSIDIGGE